MTESTNNTKTNTCIRCSVGEASLHKNEKKNVIPNSLNYSNIKKIPTNLIEMQQNFNERFYSLKENKAQTNNSNTSSKANSTNPAPAQQNSEMNMLSQIAPIFNLLSGGKNPEIGNLIGALSSGNMDMNKMLNNMVNTQMAAKSHKSEVKPVSVKPSNDDSQIKNLKRV